MGACRAGLAADVALQPEPTLKHEPVPLIDRERLAQRLAASPAVDGIRTAIQRYATRLHLVDIDDADLLAQGGVVGWARRLVTAGIGLAFIYLLLLPGLLFSMIPAVLVAVAGWIPESPVTKGTVRALTGFVLFLATWITVALLAADTAVMRLAWFGYQVAALLIALPIVEYTYGWLRSTTSWWHLRSYRSRVPELLADRAAVVDAVEEAGRAARRPYPVRRKVEA